MNTSIVVWDLETVPDLAAYARAKGLEGACWDEVRCSLGEKFPKHIYHSIVCIGALIAHRAEDGWRIEAMGAPHVGERTERELLQSFVDKIEVLNPRLVTFNGSSFDLPALRYRAMMNNVSAPGLFRRPYFNRYTEDAIDLCDALCSFQSQGKIGLDELSKSLGLSGKPDDMKGCNVEEYFRQGRLVEIAAYCVTDLINTYTIWLRYELFKGALTPAEHDCSVAHLEAVWSTRKLRAAQCASDRL